MQPIARQTLRGLLPALVASAALLGGHAVAQEGMAPLQATQLLDADVTNRQDEEIGEVVELILSADGRVEEVVLSVGGFLGMGERLVALPFADVEIVFEDPSDPEEGDVNVVVDATRETLEAMPAVEYELED